jgi:sulfoxide reductase heme-binding subunit YedZ
MKILAKRISILQVAIHLGAWLPLLVLVFDFFNKRLGANPILEVELRTGRTALTLLVISLACAPLYNLTGWRKVLKRSRTLGLYAFAYAVVHLAVFIFLDYGANWGLMLAAVLKKSSILYGAAAFLILLSLALTSFDISKRWLKMNWKRLHRLVYPAAVLVVLHYGLARKGDLFHLQGDVVQPFIYGVIVFILLLMRIGIVQQFIKAHRLRHSLNDKH